MKTAITLAACFTLGACAAPQLPPVLAVAEPVTLTKQQDEAIRQAVTRKLKDPESARFAPVIKAGRNSKGTILACGFVNGRNSYGGYTGMQAFEATIEGQNLEISGPDNLMADICQKQGLLLPL